MSDLENTRHSDENQNTGLWFITEPGHVETLAELCRIGQAESIDVDRIYWLGKTSRNLYKQNQKILDKLAVEKLFNAELREAVNDFNLALIENGQNVNEHLEKSAEVLIDKILHHIVGKTYSTKKESIINMIKRVLFSKLF